MGTFDFKISKTVSTIFIATTTYISMYMKCCYMKIYVYEKYEVLLFLVTSSTHC